MSQAQAQIYYEMMRGRGLSPYARPYVPSSPVASQMHGGYRYVAVTGGPASCMSSSVPVTYRPVPGLQDSTSYRPGTGLHGPVTYKSVAQYPAAVRPSAEPKYRKHAPSRLALSEVAPNRVAAVSSPESLQALLNEAAAASPLPDTPTRDDLIAVNAAITVHKDAWMRTIEAFQDDDCVRIPACLHDMQMFVVAVTGRRVPKAAIVQLAGSLRYVAADVVDRVLDQFVWVS